MNSHVKIFDGEYNVYIWPCVAVWAFDRFMRICRIILINKFSSSGSATYHPEANIIRLNVPVRDSIPINSGTFYFVYVYSGLKFWESHPFSLSSWTQVSLDAENNTAKQISFLIRPHNSFTRRLRGLTTRDKDNEQKPINHSTPLKVLVEGPYGTPHKLQDRNSILFVIGGSGISVALAHIRTLHDTLQEAGQHPLRRIHLIWILRDFAFFQNVFDHELSEYWFSDGGLATKLDAQIEVYVTGDVPPSSTCHHKTLGAGSDIKTGAELDVPKVNEQTSVVPQGVNIYDYRPHVEGVVVDAAMEHAIGGKMMALISCGPYSMADDVRAGVVEALWKGCDGLEFRPELFNW